MKLWLKSSIALASTGAVAGIAVGSIAAFEKTNPNAKGDPFASSTRLVTGFPKNVNLQNLSVEHLSDATLYGNGYEFKFDASETKDINGKSEKSESGWVLNGKNWVKWDDFREAYIEKFNDVPNLTINLGPAIFTNEYLDAVGPKEFAEYVVWFLKNVSWGSDLASLEHFALLRGVKTAGASIILGEHTNTVQEKTTIEFYPDAFFGSLPTYSQEIGFGQQQDNLLFKLTDLDNTLLTLDEIQELVDKKKEIQENKSGDLHIRTIKAIEPIVDKDDARRDGKMGYEVYADIFPGLIDSVLAKYPYLAKDLNGPHINEGDLEPTGVNGDTYRKDILVREGNFKGLDVGSRIPYLAVLGASDPNFKGVGINWLKYVGQHEYGHHNTLTDASDDSEDAVFAGAGSLLKPLNSQKMYNAGVLNRYLQARSHSLGLTSTGENGTGAGQFLSWIEGQILDANGKILPGKQELADDIFGAINPNDVDEALKNNKRRALNITLGDLGDVANARANGTSVSDLTIMNAWDNISGSINPGYSGDALVFEKQANAARWVLKSLVDRLQNNLVLKDVENNPIVINYQAGIPQFVIQEWVDAPEIDGHKQYVEFTTQSIQNGTAHVFLKPQGVAPDFDVNTAKRRTIVKAWKNGKADPVPFVQDNCSAEDLWYTDAAYLSEFANKLTINYNINGWTNKDSRIKGVGVSRTTFEQGVEWSDQQIYEYPEVFQKRINASEDQATFFMASRDQDVWSPMSGYQKLANDGDLFDSSNIADQLKSFTVPKSQDVLIPFNAFEQFGSAPYQFGSVNALGTYINVGTNYNPEYLTILPSGNWKPARSEKTTSLLSSQRNAGNPSEKQTYGLYRILDEKNRVIGSYIDPSHKAYFHSVSDYSNDPQGTFIKAPHDVSKKPEEQDNCWNDDEIATLSLRMEFMDASFVTASKYLENLGFKYSTDILDQELHDWMKPTGQMTLKKLVNKFTFDPFSDFEYLKKDPNNRDADLYAGATVFTKQSLERIFNWDEVKKANPGRSDSMIQYMLSSLLKSIETPPGTGFIFIKDDLKNLGDFKFNEKETDFSKWTKSEQSWFAFLTQGEDKASAKLSPVPMSAGFQNLFYSDITPDRAYKINEIITAFSNYKDARKQVTNYDLNKDKISYSELALFIGDWHYSIVMDMALGKDASWDFAYELKVGPTSDIYAYLNDRNEDQLDDKFSDYTLNIPEMINRDYIQITYQPSTSPLPTMPSWLGEVSEAETGWEFFVSPESTEKYIRTMLLNFNQKEGFTSLADAVQTTFHYHWEKNPKYGLVENEPYQIIVMDKDKNGNEYPVPSKGIIAVGDVGLNWYNNISPNYLGRAVAQADGYLKDDFIRRGVGQELYDNQGNLQGTIGNNVIYTNADGKLTEAHKSFDQKIGRIVPTNILVDENGIPLLYATSFGTMEITSAGKKLGWTKVDPKTGEISKGQPGALQVVARIAPTPDGKTKILDAVTPSKSYATMYKDLVVTKELNDPNWDPATDAINMQKVGNQIVSFDPKGQTAPTVKWNIVGQQIYDENGDSIKDNSIRIRDLNGDLVTDRARAVWMWLLESKGMGVTVGNRNIEGLWRSPTRDASYLYGYLKNDDAKKTKFIEFTDKSTGEKKYLPITVGFDNLRYMTHRAPNENGNGDGSENGSAIFRTVEDEGYTSWFSDYTAIGGYRDAFLLSDHQYTMNFVDENKSLVTKVDLGSDNLGSDTEDANKLYEIDNRTVICENGKPFGKAPNYIKAEGHEAVIYVNDQFNS